MADGDVQMMDVEASGSGSGYQQQVALPPPAPAPALLPTKTLGVVGKSAGSFNMYPYLKKIRIRQQEKEKLMNAVNQLGNLKLDK